MLKKKASEIIGFKPLPFVLAKPKKGNLVVQSRPINWDSLDSEQLHSQKLHCFSVLWELEKEGVITYQHLEPYFHAHLKSLGYSKQDIKSLSKLKEWQVSFTLLKISFLSSLGMKSEESMEYFNSTVKALLEKAKAITDVAVVKAVPKRTIQEAMAEQLSDIIADLQELEDKNLEEKHDILKWLQTRNVPKVHIDAIANVFKPVLNELKNIGKDAQLQEAYAKFSKKQIKTLIAWYENMLTDLDAFKRVKQSQRKVRTVKPKSPMKLVSKLKYMPRNEDYKIESIKPESIIGCNTLWIFNTKTRKLCVYVASEMEKELTVKGTTIIGWDPKLSVGKTLRKPYEQLKEFMSGGKVHMRNFLKDIRGKEAKMNGRINKDILLLKVY